MAVAGQRLLPFFAMTSLLTMLLVTSFGGVYRQPSRPLPRKVNQAKLSIPDAFVIDKPLYCDPEEGATMDLMVVVTSAVTHFQAREAIRKTWGALAVALGSRVLFLVASSVDETVQHQVDKEEFQYNDILQASFIDHYNNLTLKTLSLMRWVNSSCSKAKFVLKVDDDMFVNMEKLVDYCKTNTFKKTIIGRLAHKWFPVRHKGWKWYIPESDFSGATYPDFTAGPAYLFTGDSAKPLLQASSVLTQIYLEDVYVTGIVAEKAHVSRIDHQLMHNYHVNVDACNFKTMITSHMHSPQDIVQLWKIVHDKPVKPCS
ncbi:Beta-1,3-galactosyltransferase 2 [Halotydeus destructor]|nr:Beta-1,3-galactosyltransferase 2 [Halotydeus destructor]